MSDVKEAEVVLPDDDGDGQQLDRVDVPGALEEAQINAQVATAKRYPRSITKFRKTLKEYVTATPQIAEKMYYSIPRGKNEDGSKKFIEGESVRLAEAAVAAWQNTRSGGMVVGADATHVTCRGFCHDLENNNFVAFEVRRRITGASGKRFNEDMITVTGAAGAKIAWRNSVFGVIPRIFIREGYNMARACAAGALKSVGEARKEAVEWWKTIGGKQEELLAILGKPGIDDLNIDDLLRLKGLRTALEEGETTLEAIRADLKVSGNTVVATPGSISPDAVKAGTAEGQNNAPPPGSKEAKAARAEPEKKAEPPKADPEPGSPADDPGVAEAASLFD